MSKSTEVDALKMSSLNDKTDDGCQDNPEFMSMQSGGQRGAGGGGAVGRYSDDTFFSEGHNNLINANLDNIMQDARHFEISGHRASFESNDMLHPSASPNSSRLLGFSSIPLSPSVFSNTLSSAQLDSVSCSSDYITAVNPYNTSSKHSKSLSSAPSIGIDILPSKSFNLMSSTRSFVDTPIRIMGTHFRTLSRPVDIEIVINSFLAAYFNLSFQFDKEFYKWSILLTKGSTRSNVEIHVYEDYSDPSCLIIEANRLKGNCDLFHMLFNDLKLKFGIVIEECKRADSFGGICPDVDIEPPPADIFSIDVLQPVLNMVKHYVDAEEASSILSDLSFHHEVQEILCSKDVMPIFVGLMKGCVPHSKSNVVLALLNLSEVSSFQPQIIASGIISHLIPFVADGSYDTFEMRRNCACLMANLAASFSSDFANCFENNHHLKSWLQTFDKISDKQVRNHADRIKRSLISIATA